MNELYTFEEIVQGYLGDDFEGYLRRNYIQVYDDDLNLLGYERWNREQNT